MDFLSNYNRLSAEIEAALPLLLAQRDLRVIQAANYSLTAGGKRFRAVLALAVADALELPREEVLPFAIAVECLHAATLIHDDLPALDNDELRRGKPTCHRAYDEATAILAADLLFAEAFRSVAGAEGVGAEARIAQTAELAAALALLCEGQDLDLQSAGRGEGRPRETLPQLEDRHLRKTGALIKACAVGPVYLLGERQVATLKPLLSVFGTNLGLLFQVTDDLLETTGTTEQLGKSASSDAQRRAETFVTLLGSEGARDYARELHAAIAEQLANAPFDSGFLGRLADFVLTRDR